MIIKEENKKWHCQIKFNKKKKRKLYLKLNMKNQLKL